MGDLAGACTVITAPFRSAGNMGCVILVASLLRSLCRCVASSDGDRTAWP